MFRWIKNQFANLFLMIPWTSFHGYPNEDRQRYYFYYDITIRGRTYEVFSHSRKMKHKIYNRGDQYVD